ncbi:MAG: AMP-binding protein [Marinirhabdus sp.]|nr:AMP-binding protein [Marinirhabdus sp.]
MTDISRHSKVEIQSLQDEKLRATLHYVYKNSAFYSRVYSEAGIDVSSIQGIADLHRLPLTSKDDLQRHNEAFFCVPKEQFVDLVTTSGTLGNPVTVALTENDLQRLTTNEAMALACAGIQNTSTVQLMTTIDRRFMAGLAYFMGLRELGASVIRVGSGLPELQWDSIQRYRPTHIICVPSFLLKLIDYAKTNGITLDSCGVKAAICIGEPVRDEAFELNSLGKKIKNDWDINLYSTYAATEMQTAFTECEMQQGGHLLPDLIVAEILDENDRPVTSGEPGELVITTLGVEGMPLVRFKTGDMVQLHSSPCSCGRNTPRLGPVIGRKQQMIKYKGTTIYPPAMYNVLEDFNNIESFVIEIDSNDLGTDEIVLKVVSEDISEAFKEEIKNHFRAKLRVSPSIEFTTADHIKELQFPKMSRKPIVFIDKR